MLIDPAYFTVMALSVGFDPVLAVLGSTEEKRPPEREPDSRRITPITETELPSAESRQRLNSPDALPWPTRVAFTAKFGPDQDGFPLQLIRGEQVTGAESIDVQVIFDNRVSPDSQTALLQAQESRGAVAEESQRQQEAAAQSRQENNLAASAQPTEQAPVTIATPESPATGATLETPVTGATPGTPVTGPARETTPTTPTPDTPVTAVPPVTTEPDEPRTKSGTFLDLQV